MLYWPFSGGQARPDASGGEGLPQVEKFQHLQVLVTSEGKMEPETDRRISSCVCSDAVAVVKEPSPTEKLWISRSMLWVMTDRMR